MLSLYSYDYQTFCPFFLKRKRIFIAYSSENEISEFKLQ